MKHYESLSNTTLVQAMEDKGIVVRFPKSSHSPVLDKRDTRSGGELI
jgi:hypothetical protein